MVRGRVATLRNSLISPSSQISELAADIRSAGGTRIEGTHGNTAIWHRQVGYVGDETVIDEEVVIAARTVNCKARPLSVSSRRPQE